MAPLREWTKLEAALIKTFESYGWMTERDTETGDIHAYLPEDQVDHLGLSELARNLQTELDQ